jgi:hypothetical protein
VNNIAGSGAYSLSVSFANGVTCSQGNQTGGYSCTTSTGLASFGVSVSGVEAGQVLCSVTPSDLASGGTVTETLSPSAPTLSVSLVVANNSNKCP